MNPDEHTADIIDVQVFYIPHPRLLVIDEAGDKPVLRMSYEILSTILYLRDKGYVTLDKPCRLTSENVPPLSDIGNEPE